jgi:hypothetical protein
MPDDPTAGTPSDAEFDAEFDARIDDPADDLLLAELAEVLAKVAAPPPGVVEAAKGLFTWRTIDAELAELAYDSLVAGEDLGVRAAGQPRILTFEAGGLTVEVEVDDVPGARRLIGQLTPPGQAGLELHTTGDTVLGEADDLGRFVLPLPPAKLRSSLRIRRGETTTETAWVLL